MMAEEEKSRPTMKRTEKKNNRRDFLRKVGSVGALAGIGTSFTQPAAAAGTTTLGIQAYCDKRINYYISVTEGGMSKKGDLESDDNIYDYGDTSACSGSVIGVENIDEYYIPGDAEIRYVNVSGGDFDGNDHAMVYLKNNLETWQGRIVTVTAYNPDHPNHDNRYAWNTNNSTKKRDSADATDKISNHGKGVQGYIRHNNEDAYDVAGQFEWISLWPNTGDITVDTNL